MAKNIAEDVLYLLNGKEKFVLPWDLFPELFAQEQKRYEAQCEAHAFEDYKERRRQYAEMMNARNGGADK